MFHPLTGVYAALFAVLAAPATSQTLAVDRATIVLEISPGASELSIEVLKREIGQIRDLPVRLEWFRRSDVELGQEFARPIQVGLRGRCHMKAPYFQEHTPGRFAWTHMTDGEMLPFIEIDCERLRSALFAVMWGEDFQQRDFLLGRALARVLAHELHHVLANHGERHAKRGLAREALTAESLIRGQASLYAASEGQ